MATTRAARTRGRGAWWALALACATVGLLLGPVLMEPVYVDLAPRLGPSTLLVVELIFAFLIDIPLAGTFVMLRCLAGRRPTNPARSALAFVGVFFLLIGLCIALSPVHRVFAWLGLATTFRPAVAAATSSLGTSVLAVMLVTYLAFDLLLCAAAGIAGDGLVRGRGTRPTTFAEDDDLRSATK